MGVTYRSQLRTRERILAYGQPGVGKSNAILTVARRCPDTTFHVIDTEIDNYDRLLETDFTDCKNVEVYPVYEWAEVIPTLKKLRDEVGREDWVVLDSITPTWDWVQEWFIEKVHGEDDDEYFLQVRIEKQKVLDNPKAKDPGSLGALEGWMDWPVINKTYYKLYKELLNIPCHVYLTAEATKVIDEDDRETRRTFGAHGVRPKGQKRLGFIPQTVLLMGRTRTDKFTMDTVKDRGRDDVEGREVGEWVKDYLVKTAGWKPAKTE